MSFALLVPTAVGGAQGAVSTASQMANLLAGFKPKVSGFDIISDLAKDIGSFAFDYIGEERIEAGTEITDHYTEKNAFMQDHCAVKPSIVTMRGFISESAFNKATLLPFLTAAVSALTPVTPYIGKYAPGAAAKMVNAQDQALQIINQLAQIQGLAGGVNKLIKSAQGLAGAPSKIQTAYDVLDSLRTSGTTFAVVTPWATFGGKNLRHGPMMIESLVMISPDDTRTWTDIVVRLKEIRFVPSLATVQQANARVNGTPVNVGTISGQGAN